MDQNTRLVTPNTPQQETMDKLNNVLTGIVLKSGLLRTPADRSMASDLDEIEKLATEAVALVRQLRTV